MVEVRRAVQNDFNALMAWLKAEWEQTERGFYCNRGVIERAFISGQLIVAVEQNEPVAFLASGLTRDGILEVRPDKRGRGLGRLMFEAGLQEAVDLDISMLEIECAPATSATFWQRMGFTLFSERYAFMEIPKTYELPTGGSEVDVVISFHIDPDQQYGRLDGATSSFTPKAVRVEDGSIHLESRVLHNPHLAKESGDPVVRIVVNGQQIYFHKVKYKEASELGVQRDLEGNFYIDKIMSMK